MHSNNKTSLESILNIELQSSIQGQWTIEESKDGPSHFFLKSTLDKKTLIEQIDKSLEEKHVQYNFSFMDLFKSFSTLGAIIRSHLSPEAFKTWNNSVEQIKENI